MTKDRIMLVVACVTGMSTVSISMALNVWAFTEKYPGVFGASIGLMLPVWVLALTFVGEWGSHRQDRKLLGVGAYVLAGFLLVVSLPHLAHGFDKITGGRWWESWSLAIVTDLCQVVMKLAVINIAKQAAAAKAKAERPVKQARTKRKASETPTVKLAVAE